MRKMPPEATWRARKWQTIFNLRKADRETKALVLADNLSNLRELKRNHEKYGDMIWEHFNQKDKKMQEWYFKEIEKIVSKEFEYEYYEEMEEYSEMLYPVFEQKENWWE